MRGTDICCALEHTSPFLPPRNAFLGRRVEAGFRTVSQVISALGHLSNSPRDFSGRKRVASGEHERGGKAGTLALGNLGDC